MGSLEEEKKNNSGGSPEVDHSVRDIAIIGIACRFPEADDYNQYWDNLIQGKNSIKEIPPDRWDTDTYYSPNIEEPNKSVSKWCGLIDNIDRFDNRFFNISPREAKNMDPQQRLLMEETWHCIEDAGVPLETLSEKSTAVYIGVMADDYLQEASSPNVIIDSYAGLGNYDCILANRISYFFNFTGASMAVHAACASSLVAMHEARRSLIMKECHYALAGGVSLNFFPWKYISFSKSRMLSPDGQCKTFDKDANGYVPGEGIGVVLLQPLVDAVAAGNHVYGVIKGSAVNHGGKTLSITAPRVESQRDLILTAYADAGFSPATVSYAEAHGTGTSLGDPIEIEAQTLAFREFTDEKEFCKIGSVKTNIGHLEASAGVAGVVKVLMMMRHKKIPKSLNVSVVNPIINFMETPFSVALEDAGDWVSRSDDIPLRASVSSFGFGGVNSFTLLEEFPENSRDSIINNLKLKDPTMILPGDIGDEPDYFFLLSARSSSSLENMISRWKDFSQSDSFTRSSLPDTCATLIRGRGHFPFRFGVRLSKKENLFDALNNAEIFSPESGNRPWCFRVGDFFWSNPGFMKTLRDESPLFRVNLEKIESRLSALDAPADMLHSLYSSDWPEPSRQLFSFMAAFAFVMTLLELGFSPDVMTGEKHGVLVALVAVDIMRLDDALVVLLNRKELKDILFTRPSIPYYDPVLKKTAMPFHFDQEYLRLLVDELSRQSKLLGQILVDGIFVTQDKSKDDSVDRLAQTQLGILLLHDGAVTQEQLDNALAAQKESGDLLGHILVEKRFCSSADLAEALREQDVLRYYVVDVLSHYVDKARLLNTSQFTFRKFLDEWDAILKNSNTDISSLLYDDQLLVQEGGRLRKEKLLLMVVIMTSLRKLNQKWNLTELHLVEDKRFYELVNLVADNIMPKEALVDLLLSDNPDFKGIAHSLNKRQINRNLNNDYRFIERTNPNIREIDDVSAWLSQAMEIENVTGEQMAYYPVEDMSFLEFGVFSDSSGFSNSRVCCNMGDSLFDLYKDSLLSLWHMGVNFQWELLFPEGCFRKAALPVYAFEGKAFWLSGKEGIHERVEAPVVRKAVPVSKLKQSDEKGMVYSRTFTPEDRIIQDHVITGKGIIPGAGMIEMGCEGAQRATGQPVTLLKNVVVLNPGIVGSGLAVDVEVDPGEKQFFVKSKDGNLCKGDFDSAEPDKIASFDFSDYRNKQPEDISGLYKALSRIGYEYGDGLQVIKNVRKFDKGYIFELQESSKEEGLFSNISPNLLDGIFQLPFTEKYLRGEFSENEGLFIPYMISSLTIFDVLQDRCFIVLNNEDLERKGNDLFVQLHVYNHLGKPVLDIRNMVFKKVPNDFLTQFMQPDLASGLAREEIKKVFYYQPAWIQRPIQKIGKLEAKEKLSGRTAIVFLDKDGLSDSLSKEIDGLYLRIFYIIQGSGFLQKENNTFEIDSSNNKDYKDCISRIFSDDAVSAGNCDIYHLWSYEPEVPVINNGNDLLTRQENGVRSLFFLAQALTGVRLSEKVNIIMGTCDCYSVEPNNKGNGYYTGGISGLAKTVMMENPKIKIKIVDFAANTGTVLEKSQLIFDEAISFDSEELVAYRTNGRCVRVIEEAPPAGNDAASVWKENGVYLLIGGAGGIGIKIAEFISEHITCKLVILGRSELSKEKTKQFDALGSSGSDILYLRGDVTHKDQMIQTISTIKEKYGTLNGIIHAGGLLDDKLLMSKDWESFIRVLAPKVAGVWNIHEATKSEQLDFFVVFSSIVAVAGNIGQSDYAAANSFLDSFISYRSQNNFPGKSVSINWTLWADVGMGVSDAAAQQLDRFGLAAISSLSGLKAFEQILNLQGNGQIVVAGQKVVAFEQSKETIEKENVFEGKADSGELSGMAEEDRISGIENYLAKLVAKKLGSKPEDINKNDSFFDLGIESIVIQEIMGELDKKYDHLSATLLFEYTNIRELAKYLVEQKTKDSDLKTDSEKTGDDESSISEIENYLCTLIAAKLDSSPDDINKSDSFFDLGVESIAIQEIMNELDKKYDHLPATLFFEYTNINELAEYLIHKKAKDIDSEITKREPVAKPVSRFVENKSEIHGVAKSTGKDEGYNIAIVGMNGRFPKSPDIYTYWKNLEEGRDCIEEIPLDRWDNENFFDSDPKKSDTTYGKWGGFIEDVDKFDPIFFGISPREAEQMDPQQRLFLECVWGTMEHAGYGHRNQYEEKVVGLFVGTMWNEYSVISNEEGFSKNRYVGPGSIYWGIANRVSYCLDLKGPSLALDTACSSSLVAVHLACESILNGNCEMAIAGGVNLSLHPAKYIYLSQAKFLSTDGRCRSFGKDGDGYVPGEGIGAVLLKPLNEAIDDNDKIYGVIRGSSSNHGGKAAGFTVPNPDAQDKLIRTAIKRAGISAKDISYIECHGTGTSLGDPIEIAGLSRAFSDWTLEKQSCYIGSVKSNIGHLEAASGIAALIKVLLAIRHNKIPKSLHSGTLNSKIEFNKSPFSVVQQTIDWKPGLTKTRIAGISSFGAGGSNAHVVVESYNDSLKTFHSQNQSELVILSAREPDQLKEYVVSLWNYLDVLINDETVSLKDVACTLQVGREPMKHRLAIIANSKEDLKEKTGFVSKFDLEFFKEMYIGPDSDFMKERGIESIFKGDTKVFRENKLDEIKKIRKNEGNQDNIPLIYKESNWFELASLWVKGIQIKWRELDRQRQYSKVGLPTYPFGGDRYWIPDSSNLSKEYYGGKNVLRPLVDRVNAGLSLNQGIVFEKLFYKTDLILNDHKVKNQSIIPGVAYLEMVYEAVSEINKTQSFNIARVVWLAPISVEKDTREIEIIFEEENNKLHFFIRSNHNSKTIVHAKGEIHYDSSLSEKTNQSIPIEEIKERSIRNIDKDELYRDFAQIGIDYGSYFQGLQKVWGNDEESLGFISLHSEYANELEQYYLHPTIMDGALQTMVGLYENIRQPLLPFAVEKVEYLSSLKEKMYAYIKMSGKHRFHVALTDETGLVCVKLHDVALRELKDTHQQHPANDLFYSPQWHLAPALKEKEEENRKQTVVIVYSIQSYQLEEHLVNAYEGDEIVTIKLGSSMTRLPIQNSQVSQSWEIETANQETWSVCIEELKKSIPKIDIIYFLGGIISEELDMSNLAELEQYQEMGVLSLFRLIKSLSKNGYMTLKPQIKIITNDIFHVLPDDQIIPYSASLIGFAKSMAREYSTLINFIDISRKDIQKHFSKIENSLLVQLLVKESSSITMEGEIAIRHDKRYALSLLPVKLIVKHETIFKHHGVYLILGGAGGIGLELSRYLSEKVQAKMVWIGRRERSKLDNRIEEEITLIESRGGEVLYLNADATDFESMKSAIEKIKSQFGKINGVIHSAIVLRDKTITWMPEEDFRAALAPKVEGSVVLYNVLKNEQLDFMLFLSSAQSFLGNAGQSNYAAACTFKDAYARYLEQKREYQVKIINWGYWGTIGIVADEAYNKRLAQQGIFSIDPKEGMEAVERILNNSFNQIMAIKADDNALKNMGVDTSKQLRLNSESISSLIESSAQETNLSQKGINNYEKLTNAFKELESFIGVVLLKAFQNLGVFKESNKQISYNMLLKEKLKISDYKTKLFEEIMVVLTKDGYINIVDEYISTTTSVKELEIIELEKEKNRIISQFPEITAYVNLLWTCLNAYPDILTGIKNPVEVMFPAGSMSLVEGIYKGNDFSDYYNQLLAQFIRNYVLLRLKENPDNKIVILEIGSGTGGTSLFVMDAVKDFEENIRYFYTDISASFTRFGKKEYGDDYPFVEFEVLNIEKNVEDGGFDLNSVDIIFGTNVIHATKNISNTLAQAKKLLKVNGLFIVNEVTQMQDYLTLSFGLTEGWWLFEDDDIRMKGSPLLNPHNWKQVMEINDFRNVQILGLPGVPVEMYEQSVIIGESDESTIFSVKKETVHGSVVSSELQEETFEKQENSSDISSKKEIHSLEELKNKTYDYVKNVFSEVLKIKKADIDVHETFENYGVDSLTIMEINGKFEEEFGELPATLLFENITVAALGDYFIENYKIVLVTKLGEEIGLYEEKKNVLTTSEIKKEELPKLSEQLAPGRHSKEIAIVPVSEDELKKKTYEYIKDVFSEVLKLKKTDIDAHETFENYGVDSLTVMEINTKFEDDFEDLPATLLFENITVEALAEYFIINHRTKLEMKILGRKTLETSVSSSIFETSEIKREVVPESYSHKREIFESDEYNQSLLESGSRQTAKNKDIAIVGISGRYPMAETLEEYWGNLKNGKNCITEIPKDRWDWIEHYSPDEANKGKIYTKWGGFINDVDKFDPLFFNISPKEAQMMDPQERLFLEIVWATLEDAGITKKDFEEIENNVGVFTGTMNGDYGWIGAEAWAKGHMTGARSSNWSIANRISYFFNLQGPSLGVDSACSTSLTAIHLACESIKQGECKWAIAGGVNLILHPMHYAVLSSMNMLAGDDKCKSFGYGADGFVDGEGVGAILLKPLDVAMSDNNYIYAVIKGSSINAGGKTSGFTVPNPNAQGNLIAESLIKAGIEPRTISYVEAHGTGTSLGDPIEIAGLEKAFSKYTQDKQYCSIGSSKSNIGHIESAAGIAGLTKIILQMKHKQLVPSINSEKLNPNINFSKSSFYIQHELMEWKQPVITENGEDKIYPRRAGISSFGAGGANAHVILEEYENLEQEINQENKSEQIIVLSARNEERLKVCVGNILDFIGRSINPNPSKKLNNNILPGFIKKDVAKIISEIIEVKVDEINFEEDFNNYGFDQVNVTGVADQINETYNIEIASSILYENTSIESLSKYLSDEYNESLTNYYNDNYDKIIDEAFVESSLHLDEIAYTLQVGREEMEERLALVVSNIEELSRMLSQYSQGNIDIDNLYRGNLKEKGKKAQFIIEGKEGEAFIDSLLNEKKLGKLAQIWVLGVEIDWKLLYPIKTPNIISMPTYPFERKRYWIPESVKNIDFINVSTSREYKYTTQLTGNMFYIADHIIVDEKTLPSVVYLEMVRIVGNMFNEKEVRKIKSVVWARAIKLTDAPLEINISLYPGRDWVEYEISSTGEDNERVAHSQGKVIYESNVLIQLETGSINIESIKERCPEIMSGTESYKWSKIMGFKYGPSYHVIQEIRYHSTEALSRVTLPPEQKEGFHEFVLHPSLMSGALQTMTIMIGMMSKTRAESATLYLPFALGEMDIVKPLSEECYIYVSASESSKTLSSHMKIFDVYIVDESGQVLVRMKDFTLREMRYYKTSKYMKDIEIKDLLKKLEKGEMDAAKAYKMTKGRL